MGWSMVITRAMPEIMEHNPDFSAFYINKRTVWDATEMKIVSIYLKKMYHLEVPREEFRTDLQLPNPYLDLVGMNFFQGKRAGTSLFKNIRSIFKSLSA